MPLVVPIQRVRHHALLIGTASYKSEEWNRISSGVKAELEQGKKIFLQKLEYDDCRTIFPLTDLMLRRQVNEWGNSLESGKDDITIVYYTGHGHVDDGGQLRLITGEIQPGEEHLAIPATELVSWLSRIEGHILVIVDTCYSGAMALDAQMLHDRIQYQTVVHQKMQFITSASSVEEARPGWFMQALSQALDEVASQYDEWLSMEKLLARVNRHLADRSLKFRQESIHKKATEDEIAGPEIQHMLDQEWQKHLRNPESQQRARFSGPIEDLSRFFPNRGRLEFIPGLEQPQAVRVLHRIQKDAFRKHWDPRARGVAGEAGTGWFFSGRHEAIARLKEKITSASAGRLLIVSGMAGSGKSALLARFVTLADRQQRTRARRAGALKGVPTKALPKLECVDFAVYAHARSALSLALEIAAAAGSDLVGEWEEDNPAPSLIRILQAEKHKRRVLLVDALDEAKEPDRAAFLLQTLAHSDCGLFIVVGLRTDPSGASPIMSSLDSNADSLNLDSTEFWDQKDLVSFVERYLRTRGGSPYVGLQDMNYVREVAEAVASKAQRSFLVATTTARSLADRSEPIAQEELPNLPTNAGEAFEMDLKKRFKDRWLQGLYVLGALAYGRGKGLPRSLWATVTNALDPNAGDAVVEYWEKNAGFYVLHDQGDREEVCRLYHGEFTRYLRTKLDGSAGSCRSPACTHSSPAACVAMALNAGTKPHNVSRYLLEHLAGYLAEGGLAEPLYTLVTAPWWQDARKHDSQDPACLLSDFALAIDIAKREPPDLRMLVRLCTMSSREVTPSSAVRALRSNSGSIEAPSVVIDTLARAGQLSRARLIADNVLFPLDRCHAHSLLAQRYHEQGSRDEALRCLAEAKRTAAAITTDFKAMGLFWVTRAAHLIGEDREARTAANQALSSVTDPELVRHLAVLGPFHTLLWTGLSLRQLADRDGLAKLKEYFRKYLYNLHKQHTSEESVFWLEFLQEAPVHVFGGLTNLHLQAASVVCDYDFLKKVCAYKLKYPHDHPHPGNLGLALADAGMVQEFEELEKGLRQLNKWPVDGKGLYWWDAGKRFVWALAILRRFEEALEVVHHISDLEARARALYRISECAERPMPPDLRLRLETAAGRVLCDMKQTPDSSLADLVEPERIYSWVAPVEPWRIYSWIAPVYLLADNKDKAIELCNEVCARGVVPSEENSLCLSNVIKAHVRLTLNPTEDEKLRRQINAFLARDDVVGAESRLRSVNSRRIRARCAVAVAGKHPDPKRALGMVLDAMNDASRCGAGELKNILDQSRPLMARVSPDTDFALLEVEFQDVLG